MWRILVGLTVLLTISCSGAAQAQSGIGGIPQKQITPTLTATPTPELEKLETLVNELSERVEVMELENIFAKFEKSVQEWESVEECIDEISNLFDTDINTANAVRSVINLTGIGFISTKFQLERACKRDVFLQRYSLRAQNALDAMTLNNKAHKNAVDAAVETHYAQCHGAYKMYQC